jgi:hypothetical protein
VRRSTDISALAAALALLIAAFLAIVPAASANKVISEPGEGAGQTRDPRGLAVDFAAGRLYVADRGNSRVDVFDATGTFEKTFGWGVKDGKAEFQVCSSGCKKGIAGGGKGQFSSPTEIAVDNDPASPSFHDIYVTNVDEPTGKPEDFRVEKFKLSPSGEPEFVFSLGGGVNQTTGGNICTAESGNICGAGSNGFGEGEFSSQLGAIPVSVGSAGVIYVGDSKRLSAPNSPNQDYESRIQRFEPSGAFIEQRSLGEVRLEGMVVDSAGNIYFTAGGAAIKKYNSSFVEVHEFNYDNPGAIAVDSLDHFFVGEGGRGFFEGAFTNTHNIVEYDSSTPPNGVRRFGYGVIDENVQGLAPYQSTTGDIYAAEQFVDRVIQIDFPPPGPLVFPKPCKAAPLGNTQATLNAELNPEGKATTYHFEYLTQAQYEAGGFSNPATQSTPESASIGSDVELHKASAQVAPLVPETKYHCRVVATNADAPGGVVGPEGDFTTLEPLEIGATWASDVGTGKATLNATVNPLGIPTTGYFEYVDEATYQEDISTLGAEHGFDHALKAPAGEPIDFGTAGEFKTGSVAISGLGLDNAYRYRIVATDTPLAEEGKDVEGPTRAFRTVSPGQAALPDGRAYELVSPGMKNNAEVGIPGTAAGAAEEQFTRTVSASSSGEAFTYSSWTSFGDPEGAPGTSQYLSKRGASGWGTENISPTGNFSKGPLEPPYRGFTPDLGFAAFATNGPALTPEVPAGFQKSLYLRDNRSGQLRALFSEVPQLHPKERFCTGFSGASNDGKRAFFAASGAMAGAPLGKGNTSTEFSLYEWSEAEGLKLASVLPNGTPATPDVHTGFGATGQSIVSDPCAMTQQILDDAVSADGSVAIWSYGGSAQNPLYARVDGIETIQLDARETGANAGPGPAGGGRFWAAGEDGSNAIFTAPGRLTKDAGAGGHLYRYDLDSRSLADLTPGATDPKIKGVLGAAEDGKRVYFVASTALSGEQEGAAGQKALDGANNLYLYHEGEGLRFIARLDTFDDLTWDPTPRQVNSRVTPDGRHLAFLSIAAESLSGYDNTIAEGKGCRPDPVRNELTGDPRCPEAYLYDADADTLTCASCNPTSARPTGPASLPAWTNPFEGPRYLSDDGKRLFFESRDVLSGADRNGRRDVYQFETAGTGTCNGQSAGFDPLTGGCLSLISSGNAEGESYLLDASADGRDVFVATPEALLGADPNQNYDIYDVRAGGGFPESIPPLACGGEACKPAPASVPSLPGPTTSNFVGSGNPPSRIDCRKGQRRQVKAGRERCIKPRKRRGSNRKHSSRRAGSERRGER